MPIASPPNIAARISFNRHSVLVKNSFTAIFLVAYLVVLLIGSISSTIYAIETDQRLFSMWNPSVIPIKVIMVFGIFLMLLQAISMFFKDLAKARGMEIEGIQVRTAKETDG